MNGILVINKPKDYTSHDIVNIIRKAANMKKIGHTGTLDPIAQGVLVLCLGKATRVSEYLLSDDKEYIADLKFGYETDTLDVTGKIINSTDNYPSKNSIMDTLKDFVGDIDQVPPIYSALKYNGKKLYEYAREGKEIDIKSRKVKINKLEMLEEVSENLYRIKIDCSSGTYIRSLIRDIAHKLSSYATMSDLIRVRSGNFSLDQAYDLEYLKTLNPDQLENLLIPMDDALINMKNYNIPDYFYNGIINGRIFKIKDESLILNEDLKIYCANQFIGIGSYIEKDNTRGIKINKMLKGD